jgi:hypothetical protein
MLGPSVQCSDTTALFKFWFSRLVCNVWHNSNNEDNRITGVLQWIHVMQKQKWHRALFCKLSHEVSLPFCLVMKGLAVSYQQLTKTHNQTDVLSKFTCKPWDPDPCHVTFKRAQYSLLGHTRQPHTVHCHPEYLWWLQHLTIAPCKLQLGSQFRIWPSPSGGNSPIIPIMLETSYCNNNVIVLAQKMTAIAHIPLTASHRVSLITILVWLFMDG